MVGAQEFAFLRISHTDADTVGLVAHNLKTNALEVLLLVGGYNGSAEMKLVQVPAGSALLSPPFHKKAFLTS